MCKTSFGSYLIDTQPKLNVQNSINTTAVVTFFSTNLHPVDFLQTPGNSCLSML